MSSEKIEIKTITIENWINAVSGAQVVLPMLQRGSVWKPHKVLDLWDSLLQGMPLGAMMKSTVSAGTKAFNLTTRETVVVEKDAISLLDGQQRTLAILSGWPEIEEKLQRPVVVWIDLFDEKPQGEYLFRLIATTRTQPFGYERSGMGGSTLAKLKTSKRRLANWMYNIKEAESSNDWVWGLWKNDDFMPWEAVCAIRISELISELPAGESNIQQYIEDIIKKRVLNFSNFAKHGIASVSKNGEEVIPEDIQNSIKKHFHDKAERLKHLINEDEKIKMLSHKLTQALKCLTKASFPLIPINDGLLDDVNDEQNDPPLAVLFKRIGSGGEKLSDEDYIFSLIKHRLETAHDLVEKLLKEKSISALYTPNMLVISAVRMTLMSLRKDKADDDNKLGYADKPKMNKIEFAKLVRKNSDNENNFITKFDQMIGDDGGYTKAIKSVLSAVAYSSDDLKVGLPKHSLPWVVELPLFDILIAWACKVKSNESLVKNAGFKMVRFLLWGRLCINDKLKASVLGIKYLDESNSEEFPECALIKLFLEEKVANSLPSPDKLADIPRLVSSEGESAQLVGWSRFTADSQASAEKEIYRRWWGNRYHHAMLLWLQREYVYLKFELLPALAGMEDETPFDFDHILPYKYWGDFRGPNGTPELLQSNDQAKTCIGNAIGNVRVWDSIDNRSDGDMLPYRKLEKTPSDQRYSLVDPDTEKWFASDFNGDDPWEYWKDQQRVKNFQQAVEQRSFSLYKRFYEDLKFDEVFPV